MRSKLSRRLASKINKDRSVSVTFGSFDGLHLGHQELLKALKSEYRIVLSFYPHPAQALGKVAHIPRISSLRQDLEVLSSFTVSEFMLLRFSKELARLSAKDFVSQILVAGLGATELVVGPDARFGAAAKGDVSLLQELAPKLGFNLKIVSFSEIEGKKISSREIRRELSEGKVAEAARSLGRPFCYEGRVVKGDGRGRKIGIPTANLSCSDQIVPGRGVYLTKAKVGDREFVSVTNVGIRPTFGGQKETIEAHLLDFTGPEFYGSAVELKFIERIRGEMKFSGVEELVAQIKRDIEFAKRLKDV